MHVQSLMNAKSLKKRKNISLPSPGYNQYMGGVDFIKCSKIQLKKKEEYIFAKPRAISQYNQKKGGADNDVANYNI